MTDDPQPPQPPQPEHGPDDEDAEALAATRERAIVAHQALGGLAVGLLLAALTAPLLFTFETAVTTWWVLAVLGLFLAIVQAGLLVYRRHLEAEREAEPTLERPEPDEIDFDEPWKEAANP